MEKGEIAGDSTLSASGQVAGQGSKIAWVTQESCDNLVAVTRKAALLSKVKKS